MFPGKAIPNVNTLADVRERPGSILEGPRQDEFVAVARNFREKPV
jgi:hypothetical protein